MNSLRSLEELALKTTDLADIIPKNIAKFVEEAARPFLFGRQLLRLDNTLVKTKGTSVHLPLRGTASAVRLSELTEPTLADVAFSTTEVTPFKLGVQLYLSQESIDASQINVINGSLSEAGIGIAQKEDDEIFSEILGRQPDAAASAGIWTWDEQEDSFVGDGTTIKFTLDESPVIEMGAVTVNAVATTAFALDYYDGEIEFDVAPVSGLAIVVKYWYSKRGVYFRANTEASFKYEDMVAARKLLASADRASNMVCAINPDDYSDILTDARFIDTSQYGASEPILNGEVGKAAGFKIVETTRVPSGTVVYINTGRAGWLVLKRELSVKPKEVAELDAYKFYLYRELAPSITDDYAVVLSVDHATDAEAIA